jgi:surfactin synthase thioesterase subunit
VEQVERWTLEAVLDGPQPLLGHDVGGAQAVEVCDHGLRVDAPQKCVASLAQTAPFIG